MNTGKEDDPCGGDGEMEEGGGDNYKGRPAKESEMRKGLTVLKEVRDRRSTRLVVV